MTPDTMEVCFIQNVPIFTNISSIHLNASAKTPKSWDWKETEWRLHYTAKGEKKRQLF